MRKSLPALLGFTLILLFVFFLIGFIGSPTPQNGNATPGNAQLTNIDFNNKVARANSWLHFPEQLLTPADIASAAPAANNKESKFGSYTMRMALPETGTYTLAFNSPIFAAKIFINGSEAEEVGRVSATEEHFAPHRKFCFYNITPLNGEISIIIQYSNFYTGYSSAPDIYIGHVDRMFSWQARSDFMRFSLAYIYLITFVLFFGIYLLNRKRIENLFFSLTCLLLAARESFIGEQYIYLFFPKVSEKVIFVIQFISIGMIVILLFSLIISIFPELIGKRRKRWFYSACALFLMVALLSKAKMTPLSTAAFFLIGDFIMIVILVQIVRNFKNYDVSRVLSAIGVLLLFCACFSDMLHHFHLSIGFVGKDALLQKTIVVFIIIQVIALFMRFMQMEQKLGKALEYEKHLTEQNQMLQAINQKRIEFFSNISHEMKTPLTVVSNYAQLTNRREQKKNAPDSYTTEKMELIASEAKRMALMVEELIDLAKIDEGGMKWEFTEVDFSKLVGEAVEKYYPVLNKNHNRLVVNLPADLPTIWADGKRIEQVLINLIANAIKFTNRGTITISAAPGEGCLQMIVSDTGRGMSPEQTRHLFERYYTSEAEKGLIKGTGLGLIVSREIVLAHGGEIDINSVPGKGTTVAVSLPLPKPSEEKSDG